MAQEWPKVGKRGDDGKHASSVVEVVSSARGTSNEMRGWGFGGGWRQSARRCGGFYGSGGVTQRNSDRGESLKTHGVLM